MRSMEFSGRNIDEAIFHGLNEMGLTIDEVDTDRTEREQGTVRHRCEKRDRASHRARGSRGAGFRSRKNCGA